jgi:hypothetical protein
MQELSEDFSSECCLHKFFGKFYLATGYEGFTYIYTPSKSVEKTFFPKCNASDKMFWLEMNIESSSEAE